MPGRAHLNTVATRVDRRPLPLRAAGVVLSCLLLGVVGSGCGSSNVSVAGYQMTPGVRATCRQLVRSLPRHVSGQARRSVTGSRYAAAWGDPPIVLRCGVGKPHGFDRFAACQTANGIDWFVPNAAFANQNADVVMTTVYRRPAVRVHLPAEYRPPVAAMVDLTRTIKEHTKVLGHCR